MATIPNAPPLWLHVIYQALGHTALILLVIPILLFRSVLHLHPATRPYPTWSYRRDMAVAFGRLYLACTTYFCLPRPPARSAWQEDALIRKQVGAGTAVKAVTAPPVGEEWRVGVARAAKGCVQPEPVPCFWTFGAAQDGAAGDARARDGERVVLYVAGGSWVMGHPQSTPFPYKVCAVSGHRVLAVNIRKAVDSSGAFPGQLLDLVAGWAYLLSLGFLPENITLLGDSSGGHLVLALSRYLAELADAAPELGVGMPGALMLISPSCDLSHAPHAMSATDFLVPYLNERAYPSLARHFPPSVLRESAYFSPAACGSFAYLAAAAAPCAVWVQYGGVENLRADIERLVARMRADGVRVHVDRVEGGVHLDAGMAFALGERGESSSWARFLQAVRTFA